MYNIDFTTVHVSTTGHDRKIILTQKIKLKKNNRYLMRTIPPDAILSFLLALDSNKTNLEPLANANAQAGVDLIPEYANCTRTILAPHVIFP